jgi:GT2 family glycosyltransferase
MSALELSIVIPTYNTARMTLKCCEAAHAAAPAAELIVVDDGSTDGTAQLLAEQAPYAVVIPLEQNSGFAVAANRGVGAARGAIVLLLNSDAIVDAAALHALTSSFADDPHLGIAGAQLLDADGALQWSGGAAPALPWMLGVVSGAGHLARFFRRRKRDDAPREVDWVSGAAMAFRREVWRDAGPLDERFRFYCQDLEFCVRARDAGWRVRVVPDARVVHARGATIAGDSALRHDPERLWCDLLAWGSRRYGRRWSFAARIALVTAAWLRVAFRSLRRRDATTAALWRGARALVHSAA